MLQTKAEMSTSFYFSEGAQHCWARYWERGSFLEGSWKKSPGLPLSAAQRREQCCAKELELLIAAVQERICISCFPSLDKQLSPAPLSCSSSPLQPSWDYKQSWKGNYLCAAKAADRGKGKTHKLMHGETATASFEKLVLYVSRQKIEMCCCSSLTLPICNSLCLRNTSRYVTVEDILFSYSTVALKQFWPLVPGDSCFWGGFFLW